MREVAQGVFQIQLQVPFGKGTANSYIVSKGRDSIVVDAGADCEQNQEVFLESLKGIGLAPRNVKAILITHAHPDHWGLARWLHQLSGAPVWVPEKEAWMLEAWRDGAEEHFSRIRRFFERHGMPQEKLQLAAALRRRAMQLGIPPEADLLAVDGKPAGALQVPGLSLITVVTPGHTLGHACYWAPERDLVFCGDHLLPDISPNVGAALGDESLDALGSYLSSLEKLKGLNAKLGLPGHGEPISDIAGRVEEIKVHHTQRLAQVTEALRSGAQTVYQVVRALFQGDMTPVDYQLAFFEVYAHLERLVREDLVGKQEVDGVLVYRNQV
ncbi:MAG: MBL fold metallo-hydrolase [Bacillota bacterium]